MPRNICLDIPPLPLFFREQFLFYVQKMRQAFIAKGTTGFQKWAGQNI